MRFFRIARIFTVCVVALGISNGTAQSLITPSAVAYEVSILAGVNTPTGLKDGIGEDAGFIHATAIWGYGTNLYIGDGPALRRIEIASRNVTTVTRLAASGRSTFPGLGSRAIIL